MSQNDTKTTSLMMSLTKNLQPATKKFFRVQTTWLSDPFEPLNRSLAQSAKELWRWWGNWQRLVLGQFQSTNILYPGSQSVNKNKQQELLWK